MVKLTGEIRNMRKALGYDWYLASIMEDGKLAIGRYKLDCVEECATRALAAAWLRDRGITQIFGEGDPDESDDATQRTGRASR